MSEPDVPTPDSAGWPTHLSELAATAPSGRRAELIRLATEARRLLHGLVMTDAPVEALAEAADALVAIADVFDAPERRSIHEGFGEAATSGDVHAFFDHSPILGAANPIAPPMHVFTVDEATMGGRATFGAAYEGPPGCVHGGYVAAAFDEILGIAQSLSGQSGMTVSLKVDYRAPTPLHQPLELRGHFERTEGRKVFTYGTLHAGDVLCAEATGIFVTVDFGRLVALRAARAAREDARASSRVERDEA